MVGGVLRIQCLLYIDNASIKIYHPEENVHYGHSSVYNMFQWKQHLILYWSIVLNIHKAPPWSQLHKARKEYYHVMPYKV
jgi:hypothetical protein